MEFRLRNSRAERGCRQATLHYARVRINVFLFNRKFHFLLNKNPLCKDREEESFHTMDRP